MGIKFSGLITCDTPRCKNTVPSTVDVLQLAKSGQAAMPKGWSASGGSIACPTHAAASPAKPTQFQSHARVPEGRDT